MSILIFLRKRCKAHAHLKGLKWTTCSINSWGVDWRDVDCHRQREVFSLGSIDPGWKWFTHSMIGSFKTLFLLSRSSRAVHWPIFPGPFQRPIDGLHSRRRERSSTGGLKNLSWKGEGIHEGSVDQDFKGLWFSNAFYLQLGVGIKTCGKFFNLP